MTEDQQSVLRALYEVETARLHANQFDGWASAEEIAQALPADHARHGDATWVRAQLRELWIARKVLQVPASDAAYELCDVVLSGRDAHGQAETRLPVETNDCRGHDGYPWERVACYSDAALVRYRSRVAEISRLVSLNYQRFRMAPSTGLLRYERRPQSRPKYAVEIGTFSQALQADIQAGSLRVEASSGSTTEAPLDASVDRTTLSRAVEAVLTALAELFLSRGQPARLAVFQARSVVGTLCGLYSERYRARYDAHVVTAGVGSGKSYAFQVGALIHVAYQALRGQRRIQVLLLYPRVVLAANQFQDLFALVAAVASKLGVPLAEPVLDAGGQLSEPAGDQAPVRGQLFAAIQEKYQGNYQIIISNLDTLTNRLVHPEASQGLLRDLDLLVLDEVHVLSGLYGAHAKMLLRRLTLMRALWRLRGESPAALFEELLTKVPTVRAPYTVAASATISEPGRHLGRILSREPRRILHLEVGPTEETGWVHHLFVRQRPEASSMTAATNAVSCLVHNRRDGLYREYYQRSDGSAPPRLEEVRNPATSTPGMQARDTRHIHKTLGFCDSLDGVNRWADLIADNERTKAASMGVSAGPVGAELPYFARFQEPLWRVLHHWTFAANPPSWVERLWQHYGSLCRDCKCGVKRRIPRIPDGLRQAQRENVERLWDLSVGNPDSFLARLGVAEEYLGAPWFAPVRDAAGADSIGNLDECALLRAGLCWWWSRDHLGSNHPRPTSGADPLNGYKKPAAHPAGKYHALNAVRLRSFTSKVEFDAAGSTINDIYRSSANQVFRDRDFDRASSANCALVIGSPRIEVGIDLSRVGDGITFRAMRDPASLQQKVGRVGREMQSDSLLVHVVTDNARDHFYFRNPRIALDPDYLQPIPLHENNRVVARNHYFMAIIDFLSLQGAGPSAARIANDGERVFLINDHRYNPSFQRWETKVRAVYDFLFGGHARQAQNHRNLVEYLGLLGARTEDISNPAEAQQLTPVDAPTARHVGAVDVFEHEFGPAFLLTAVPYGGQTVTLAQICSTRYAPPPLALPNLPRHAEFIRTLPIDDVPKRRSYLWQVLTLPVFRRGIPLRGIPGDQPYLWTPSLFEAVGTEYVRVFEEIDGQQRELGYETVSLALALLSPGTVTYRYTPSPRKIPVARLAARGLSTRLPATEAVRLDVDNRDYFEPARCANIAQADVPAEFLWTGVDVPVYTPRQIGAILSSSEPLVSQDGLMADGDSRPADSPGSIQVPTPPRCFPLRWYRIDTPPVLPRPRCRFQTRFRAPAGHPPVPELPLPPVFDLFERVGYAARLEVTDFVWGLDRQFMTRQIEPARLVYWTSDEEQSRPAVLGHHYQTAGIRFELSLGQGTAVDAFLRELWEHPESGVHRAVLSHVLYEFLVEHARKPPAPDAPPWMEPSRPSVFTVRNLRTIIWFHLLERWHPAPATGEPPSAPFRPTLDDLFGCFTPGRANFISDQRFVQLCRWVAAVQNPASVDNRFDTLRTALPNLEVARQRAAHLGQAFFRKTAEELLLNTLGLTLHAAALRLTGAESGDLAYFYKRENDGRAAVYLFDTDDFGNGTSDLISETFYVSAAERILVAKQRALGGLPDPLPTTDFASCLEDALQECESAHASHLAYHSLTPTDACFHDLQSPREGERQIAGPAMDFLRTRLGLQSVDDVMAFQACPEFLAHVSQYPCHANAALVPSPLYPTFQALESAMGFCIDGCISCVVSPEQNIRGVLSAKDTVSKLLLDAAYRFVVCESSGPLNALCYPGKGPGRTERWEELALRVVTAMAQTPPGAAPIAVELDTPKGAVAVTLIPAAGAGPWNLVFRPTWSPAPPPEPRVRPRLVF